MEEAHHSPWLFAVNHTSEPKVTRTQNNPRLHHYVKPVGKDNWFAVNWSNSQRAETSWHSSWKKRCTKKIHIAETEVMQSSHFLPSGSYLNVCLPLEHKLCKDFSGPYFRVFSLCFRKNTNFRKTLGSLKHLEHGTKEKSHPAVRNEFQSFTPTPSFMGLKVIS